MTRAPQMKRRGASDAERRSPDRNRGIRGIRGGGEKYGAVFRVFCVFCSLCRKLCRFSDIVVRMNTASARNYGR